MFLAIYVSFNIHVKIIQFVIIKYYYLANSLKIFIIMKVNENLWEGCNNTGETTVFVN